MAIRVALHHKTSYRYDRPVILFPHEVRLRPAPHARTPVLAYSLTVQPTHHLVNWQQDPYGNYIARFVFPSMADTLEFTVDLIADMTVINPFDFFIEGYAEKFPFSYPALLKSELAPYLNVEQADPILDAWIAAAREAILPTNLPTVQFLIAINQRLQADIAYLGRMEAGVQAPAQTLALRQGSCRDSAWLLVQILREMGLAARFVSGYLIQLEADQQALDGPSGSAADFTDLHAWAEVFIPGAGWIGLDATSGMLAAEGHIPLACTATPTSAAPVTGASAQADVVFSHEMSVTRIHDTPRTGKPFSETAWKAMMALGQQVETELAGRGQVLTQRREHSFVAVDDMDGAQWTTVADGQNKRELASRLLQGLKKALAPGGLTHLAEEGSPPDGAATAWTLSLLWQSGAVGDVNGLWPDCSVFAASPLLPAEPSEQGLGRAEAIEFAERLGREARSLPHGTPAAIPEVRAVDGRLHVAMPESDSLENYLALLRLVASTAVALNRRPVLAGCLPPQDSRVAVFNISAPPGSIKVQLPAAASWDWMVRDTELLYQEARLARLSAEKFTAGGGHVASGESDRMELAGSIPQALFQSLTQYWQHHPALSYLFSGASIGPAGHAPRQDEAGEPKMSEFSWQQSGAADSLTAPALENAIVNRSFATPPHSRMSLLQTLLLRTLAARFLAQPYRNTPVDWGGALHDKWMLPHFLAEDMREVVRELTEAGYPFEAGWFDAFIEFRFPRCGTATFHGVELSLREALEPAGEGMLQRVELSVRGLTDGRHLVACNGRVLPLHPAGRPGEFVAGVRFCVTPAILWEAGAPAAAATQQPQAYAPLTFDLVDTWNERAIGGFTYHVRDPGGSLDSHAPVNANAAEARRAARFQPFGHTAGPFEVRVEARNPAMSMTLDLCWPPAETGVAPG
jgi:uncharacterized protein (DUF2126 family)/transglutaminase-like putative cysteine protease